MTSFLLRGVRLVELVPGTGHGSEPVDVRIQDERVAEIGIGLDRPAGVPEYDGGGRWLMPGLWDHHVHLGQWTMTSSRLDLAGTTSVADALGRVTERLRRDPDAPLLVGWGHRSAVWDRAPTVDDLDLVSGARPVVLISGDGHHAWVNSAGLAALGLEHRQGMVEETEWYAAYVRLTELVGPDETGPDAYRRTMDAAAAWGSWGWSTWSSTTVRGRGRPARPRGRCRCGCGSGPMPTPWRSTSPSGCAPVTRCRAATPG